MKNLNKPWQSFLPIKVYAFAFMLLCSIGAYGVTFPTISNISPLSADVGSTITITGTNFSTTLTNNIVYFGIVKATVTSATATSLKVTVPPGASYGSISVTVGGKTAYSTTMFTQTFSCGGTLDTSGFDKPVVYSSGGVSPEGGTLADLDGDGLADLIEANNTSNTIAVFLNINTTTGLTTSSFATPQIIRTSGNPFMVATGDLNGDGLLDVVVGGFSTDSFSIFENTSTAGHISFASPLKILATGNVCRMQIFDMDGDGLPDIVMANRSKFISIWKNNGAGSPFAASNFTKTDLTVSASAQMNDVAVADLDGDGKMDFVTSDLNSANMYVFINNGSLSFTEKTISLSTNNVWGLGLADIDGDGKIDISGCYRFGGKMFVFLNTTSGGSFSLASETDIITPSGSTLLCFSVSDLNGDGKPDLIGADLASKNGVCIVQNNSTPGTLSFGTAFGLANKSQALVPCIGDIDGDGKPDIFIQDNSSKVIGFRNKSGLSAKISPSGSKSICSTDSFKYTSNSTAGVTYQWNLNGSPIANATGSFYYAKTAGSYTLTITLGACSATSAPDTLNVNAIATTVSVLGSTTRCQNDSVQMVAAAGTGYTYQWRKNGANISGATKINFTATTSGTYKVVITNSLGCKDSSSGKVITINPNPLSNAGSSTGICSGSSAILGAAGTAGLTYSWASSPVGFTSASANPTASPTATTIYTVTTSAAATGCASTASVTITVNPLPVANPGSSSSICSGSSTGIGSAATSGSTYAWTSSPSGFTSTASSNSVSPSATTTYTVTETVTATGCKNSNSATVTVKTLPAANAGSNASVCSGSSASIGAASVSGSTYSWTSSPSGFSSNASSASVSPGTTTTYFLTETNSGSCSKSSSVTITVNPIPAANAGSSLSVCSGSSASIGAASVSGSTYAWTSSPSGFTSTASSNSVSPSATTTYTVTETVTASGCKNSNSATVTVNTLPAANAGSSTSVCSGSSASIGATSVSGSTYSWTSSPSGFSSNASSASVSPSTTTTYFLTETNSVSCSKTSSVTITVNPLPAANAGSSVSVCSGSSASIGAASVSGSTYAWTSSPSGFTSTASSNSVNPSATTTYTVTETVTASGCKNSNSATVTVNTLPAANAGSSTSVCAGNSATIGAVSVAGSTYAWTSSPSGFSSTASTASVTPATTTTYFLTETNAAGCSKSSSVTITVNSLPAANAGSSLAICSGSSASIGAAAITGSTYSWTSSPSGFTSAASSASVNPTATTTYTLLEKITATGCSNSKSVTVTVNTLPGANAGSSSAVCSGSSATIGATAVSGSTYAWTSSPSGFTSTAATSSVSPATTTSYTLVETITATGCTKTNSLVITVNPLPLASAGSAVSICAGSSTIIGGPAVSGNTYSWSPATSLSSGTASNPAATPTGTTTYSLTEIITATGCTKSNSVTVTILNLPAAAAGSASTICAGQSAFIGGKAVSGSSYSWISSPSGYSSASANATVSPGVTTTYTVTEKNAAGCSQSNSVVVNVNPRPIALITAVGATSRCQGDSVIMNANTASGISYQWKTGGTPIAGATNSTFVAKTSGNYYIVVTSTLSGCVDSSSSINVIIFSLPASKITSAGPTTACIGNSVPMSISTTGSGFTYQWYLNGTPVTGATKFAYSATTAGAYTATVTNTNGCSALSNSLSVTINPLPVVGIKTQGALTRCDGDSDILIGTIVPGATYQWSADGSGNIVGATEYKYVAKTTGNYRLTITSTAGCVSDTTGVVLPVTFNPIPTASVSPASAAICPGQVQTIRTNLVSGATYTWMIDNSPVSGVNANSIAATVAGSYSVMITNNATGCSNISPVAELKVHPAAIAIIKAIGTTNLCSGSSVLLSADKTIEVSTYQWGADGIPLPGASSDTFNAFSAGKYNLTVTNSFGCNSVSDNLIVTASTPATVVIAPPAATKLCQGASVMLHAATTGAKSMQWILNGNKITGATNDSVLADKDGNYILMVTNADGCDASASIAITINPVPFAMFSMSENKVCAGNAVSLYNQSFISSGTLTYIWVFGNGDSAKTQNTVYTYKTPGTYHIQLWAVSATGCSSVIEDSIIVQNINASTFTSFHEGFRRMVFTPTDMSGTTYEWNFGDNTISTDATPVHQYAADGKYIVTLTVTNASGCSTSTTSNVTVNASGISKAIGEDITVKIFPNPFQTQTNVVYALSEAAAVSVDVYDILGKRVSGMDNVKQMAGEHSFIFNGEKPGTYFIRLLIDGKPYISKVIKQN